MKLNNSLIRANAKDKSIYPSIYLLWIYSPFHGPWPLFQFLNPIQSVGLLLPGVEFEPTIPVFERAKMVRALDRAANVISN
jgi:hypothetical protein